MSNNIYDILKKMQNLETPKAALTESKKAKPDYIDIDKDGDTEEPMKKAAREKSKGAIAEAVARVEQQLAEKYQGFKKAQAAGKKLGEDYQSDIKARDKESRAANFEKDLEFIKSGGAHRDTSDVEYDRHGNPAFDVNTRRKMEKDRTYPVYRHPGIGDGMPDRPVPGQMDEGDIDESGLQAYLGKKKYGKEGMTALQRAGREGASKEKMARIRAQHDKMDEDSYNEDMLSPAQKKFAALAEPKDKITYADKIAGAKKKDEGNEFSGKLDAAREAGKKEFKVGDKTYPVKEGRSSMREGWEEMQKYLEKKRGPESKGDAGKKAGTRYGGSAQKDDGEDVDGEGQPTVKKKGRPKGTGGGAKFSFKKPKD